MPSVAAIHEDFPQYLGRDHHARDCRTETIDTRAVYIFGLLKSPPTRWRRGSSCRNGPVQEINDLECFTEESTSSELSRFQLGLLSWRWVVSGIWCRCESEWLHHCGGNSTHTQLLFDVLNHDSDQYKAVQFARDHRSFNHAVRAHAVKIIS